MSQSLCALYVHYVWSTKNRHAFIGPPVRGELHAYISTVVNELGCRTLQVGGTNDHIHILCVQGKNLTVPAFVEKVKTPTSAWMKKQAHHDALLRKFYWQGGYAAFSVSASHADVVQRYIRNQEEHHNKITFQDELRTLLQKYQIPYDEKYMWD